MATDFVQGQDYVLGIDLGTTSVGWAMVGWRDGGPAGLVRAGSRVFDAGMDVDNKSGKESSRNLNRRTARLIRRQHWRRGRRLRKVFHLLKSYGLLPAEPVEGPENRQDFLNELDHSIVASPWFAAKTAARGIPASSQVMPYMLRAAALDEPLEPFFLGRALYHLAQRRGFLSNRKEAAATPNDKDKKGEEGKVKTGIADLSHASSKVYLSTGSRQTIAGSIAQLKALADRSTNATIASGWASPARSPLEVEIDNRLECREGTADV